MSNLVPWPILSNRDYEAVARVLRSGRLVGGGEGKALEMEWAAFSGVNHCVAVSSCTHAIHLALRALGVGPGDEVIVPALTFCGSVSPVVLCGATPVFADVDPRTFNMRARDVSERLSEKTRAIVVVHLHGLPADITEIARAAPRIPIVEDACQAHGARLRGFQVGGLGAIGCFSLNQVKPLGGGQGGLLVSNDARLIELVRVLASHGGGDFVGFSYGITEFAAAVARSQLLSLESNNRRARENAHRLSRLLGGLESLTPLEPAGTESTWHKYRLLLPRDVGPDDFVAALRERSVPADRWPHSLVPGRSEYRRFSTPSLSNSEQIFAHSVVVGSELYPLASQEPETMDEWANHIVEIL